MLLTRLCLWEPSVHTYMLATHSNIARLLVRAKLQEFLTLYAAILFGMSAMFLAMSSNLQWSKTGRGPLSYILVASSYTGTD